MAGNEKQNRGSAWSAPQDGKTRPYSCLTLAELCQLISDSDFEAMHEFMEHRYPFEIATGKRVGFVAFLELLQKQMVERCRGYSTTAPVIERAFDLLMDHFTHRPDDKDEDREAEEINPPERDAPDVQSPPSDEDEDPAPRQIDCRNYYRGYVDQVASDFGKKPPVNEAECEMREAELLRYFVRRQLGYCLKEARRESNPLSSRYRWKTDDWDITVSFPTAFDGDCRRKWLGEHVGRPDLSNPWEKKRIQALIDEDLGCPALVPMTRKALGRPVRNRFSPLAGVENAELQEMRRFIADEKAAQLKQQRKAIREMGKRRLRTLVLSVLENWESDEMSDAELANKFGLSTATFSRFAGKNRKKDKAALVVNIARIMKTNPDFVEAARQAGFLKRVLSIAEHGSNGGSYGT